MSETTFCVTCNMRYALSPQYVAFHNRMHALKEELREEQEEEQRLLDTLTSLNQQIRKSFI